MKLTCVLRAGCSHDFGSCLAHRAVARGVSAPCVLLYLPEPLGRFSHLTCCCVPRQVPPALRNMIFLQPFGDSVAGDAVSDTGDAAGEGAAAASAEPRADRCYFDPRRKDIVIPPVHSVNVTALAAALRSLPPLTLEAADPETTSPRRPVSVNRVVFAQFWLFIS